MPEAVISNTSPLQYLYQLGQLTLLAHFYQQVTVPPAVVQQGFLIKTRAFCKSPEKLSWMLCLGHYQLFGVST
jgi:predicted nucleic acid-binding protein